MGISDDNTCFLFDMGKTREESMFTWNTFQWITECDHQSYASRCDECGTIRSHNITCD